MVHHIFPPEGKVVIAELSISWVSNRLGHWRWPFPYRRRGNVEYDERSLNALKECEAILVEDLSSARLRALAHVEGVNIFYEISAEYWKEGASELSLKGRMYDLSPGQSFSERLEGAAVLVTARDAITWLERQGIRDTDPYFPHCLRAPPTPGVPLRKSQYERNAFIDQAVFRLHRDGAPRGRGAQAKFEEAMRAWYEDNIGKPPKKRTIRNYVREAFRRFHLENEMRLGNQSE
ncbi:MAG TPA: hypothetical protein VFF98_05850 [Novosphingobium sp.]|nr:hypothetical protein [Novosphingobium sp.]HZV08411.1 hypothetical protein [Novosphingobium sp.]